MTVTTCIGVKGGVGTTGFVSSHLRAPDGTATIGIDLDLAHGDLAHRAGIAASTTIADLAGLGAHRLTVAHLRALAYDAGPATGVVASPASAELAELGAPARVAELLELAAHEARVLVDAGSRIDLVVLTACQVADRIVLVARDDETCLRQVGCVRDLLARACAGRMPTLEVALPTAPATGARGFAAAAGLPLAQAQQVTLADQLRAHVRQLQQRAPGAYEVRTPAREDDWGAGVPRI